MPDATTPFDAAVPATAELEWKLLYTMIVAGKSARFALAVMNRLLPTDECRQQTLSIARTMRDRGFLGSWLRGARSGNYQKLERALCYLLDNPLDLATCSVEELERIPGVGPKSSRFFLLWTRPGVKHAALDVHVLRWMREQGYDAPRQTPGSPGRYRELEQAFIVEAEKRGLTPRELDAQIWDAGSGFTEQPP